MSFPPPPPDSILSALLDDCAPFTPAPLCPELRVFHARSLVEVWEAAEKLAGETLPSPFWAYPWPAGCALARVLLDHPDRVRGRRVLDLGCGGGVASLAAARAGAASVTALDIDPWALAVTGIAAARQSLTVGTRVVDPQAAPSTLPAGDLLLCADLGYERTAAPRERALLQHAHDCGMDVLVADAGRTYFEAAGLTPIATYEMEVPGDLEGRTHRVARVYERPGAKSMATGPSRHRKLGD